MKSRLLSPSSFVRLPLIAWNAPPAIISDMSGPTLLGLFGALATSGTPPTRVLKPTGRVTLPDGEVGLRVSEAERRAAVARFMSGPARALSSFLAAAGLASLALPELLGALARLALGALAGVCRASSSSPPRRTSRRSRRSPWTTRSPCRRSPRPRGRLALALARAVVGVVEAFALEVHGRRVQHAFDGHARVGIDGQRVFAEGLLQLERRPVGASVLVDRHRRRLYER